MIENINWKLSKDGIKIVPIYMARLCIAFIKRKARVQLMENVKKKNIIKKIKVLLRKIIKLKSYLC